MHKQASHISPALDDAAVGMEVTAAEGAPSDTGIAVDNAMSVMLDDVSISMPHTYMHACTSMQADITYLTYVR